MGRPAPLTRRWILVVKPPLERNPVLIAGQGPGEDHRMEGGLQPTQTPLIPRKSHAAGICIEIETGKQGRLRPEINRRILPKAGGKSGLRSTPTPKSRQTASAGGIRFKWFSFRGSDQSFLVSSTIWGHTAPTVDWHAEGYHTTKSKAALPPGKRRQRKVPVD